MDYSHLNEDNSASCIRCGQRYITARPRKEGLCLTCAMEKDLPYEECSYQEKRFRETIQYARWEQASGIII